MHSPEAAGRLSAQLRTFSDSQRVWNGRESVSRQKDVTGGSVPNPSTAGHKRPSKNI
jgi:hypothetical protein